MPEHIIKYVSNSTLHLYGTVNARGEDVMHVSGTAKILQQGFATKDWADYQIGVRLDNVLWPKFIVVVPSVSLSGISNKNQSVHAGWIVDNCVELHHKETPHLEFRLRIRDIDGYVNSVSFTAIIIGERGTEEFRSGKSLDGEELVDGEKPMVTIHRDSKVLSDKNC